MMASEDNNDGNILNSFRQTVSSLLMKQRMTNTEILGRKGTSKYMSYNLTTFVKEKNIFQPDGTYRVYWDIFTSVVVMFELVFLPFDISFGANYTWERYNLAHIILAIDITFFIDILVNFNTAYLDTKVDRYVYSRRRIALDYMRFWFWLDLVSCFPSQLIVSLVTNGKDALARNLAYVKMIKLFRIYRLRALRIKIEEAWKIKPSTMTLITHLCAIFYLAHIFACLWHWIAVTDLFGHRRTWISTFFPDSAKQTITLYVASFYFSIVTMLTVGYGDIHGTNVIEYCVCILFMLVGSIVFGVLVGRVTNLIAKSNSHGKYIKEKMDEIKLFMAENPVIPPSLYNEASAAYLYYLQQKPPFTQNDSLSLLPRDLYTRLVCVTFEYDINNVLFLKNLDSSFAADLVMKARPFSAQKGELIIGIHDIMTELILVPHGFVTISKSVKGVETICGFVTDGGFFGDFEHTSNSLAIASYTAASSCDLLGVSYENFDAAMKKHLTEKIKIHNEFQGRLDEFKKIAVSDDVHSMFQSAEGISNKPTLSVVWVDGLLLDSSSLPWLDELELNVPYEADHRVMVSDKGVEHVVELDATAFRRLYIFHPHKLFKTVWDFVIALWIFLSCLLVPLSLAFDTAGNQNSIYLIMDVFFILDILVTFNTAKYVPYHQAFLINRSSIVYSYLRSGFLMDLLSAVPYNYILRCFQGDVASHHSRIVEGIRLMYLFRLFKLSRASQLKSVIFSVELKLGLSPIFINVIILISSVGLMAHIVACIWWGVSGLMTPVAWFDEASEVYISLLAEAPIFYQYITSLYWTFATLTTVGYGDIVPINTPERLLAIFAVLLGAGVFGYIIANVNELLVAFDGGESLRTDKMNDVVGYLEQCECPEDMKEEVTLYFRHLYRETSSFDDKLILSRLSPSLRNRILLVKNSATIEKVKFLDFITNESVRLHIFQQMTPIFFDKNQAIVRQGERSKDIIFLISGAAIAFRKKKNRPGIRGQEAGGKTSPLTKFLLARAPSRSIARGPQSNRSRMASSGSLHSISKFEGFKASLSQQEKESECCRGTPSVNGCSHGGEPILSDKFHSNPSFSFQEDYSPLRQPSGTYHENLSPLSAPWPYGSLMDSTTTSIHATKRRPSHEVSQHRLDPTSGRFVASNDFLLKCLTHEEVIHDFITSPHDKKYEVIGNVFPGTFVGHVGMLRSAPHSAYVVATKFCVGYSLSVETIGKILQDEKKIGLMLQNSLAKAIFALEESLSKYQMRVRRSNFSKSLAMKYVEKEMAQPLFGGRSHDALNEKCDRQVLYAAKPVRYILKRRLRQQKITKTTRTMVRIYHSDEHDEKKTSLIASSQSSLSFSISGPAMSRRLRDSNIDNSKRGNDKFEDNLDCLIIDAKVRSRDQCDYESSRIYLDEEYKKHGKQTPLSTEGKGEEDCRLLRMTPEEKGGDKIHSYSVEEGLEEVVEDVGTVGRETVYSTNADRTTESYSSVPPVKFTPMTIGGIDMMTSTKSYRLKNAKEFKGSAERGQNLTSGTLKSIRMLRRIMGKSARDACKKPIHLEPLTRLARNRLVKIHSCSAISDLLDNGSAWAPSAIVSRYDFLDLTRAMRVARDQDTERGGLSCTSLGSSPSSIGHTVVLSAGNGGSFLTPAELRNCRHKRRWGN